MCMILMLKLCNSSNDNSKICQNIYIDLQTTNQNKLARFKGNQFRLTCVSMQYMIMTSVFFFGKCSINSGTSKLNC
jgi:hypothetical protein